MELHDDDKPVGRVLSRREIIKLLGGGSALLLSGLSLSNLVRAQDGTLTPTPTALPSCVVRPEMTEGPYFVDTGLNRFDVRFDPVSGTVKEGALLHLKFIVTQIDADACIPLPGAHVDIWHCDALGNYSDVADPGFNTRGEQWLRGYQVTDEYGVAEFLTIYPGWYPGRAVHIHFKIRTEPEAESGYEFVSQLFFPEDWNDLVHAQPPYDSRGTRNVPNARDGIYNNGGEQLLLDIAEISGETIAAAAEAAHARMAEAEATPEAEIRYTEDGYTATFTIGLDLSQR